MLFTICRTGLQINPKSNCVVKPIQFITQNKWTSPGSILFSAHPPPNFHTQTYIFSNLFWLYRIPPFSTHTKFVSILWCLAKTSDVPLLCALSSCVLHDIPHMHLSHLTTHNISSIFYQGFSCKSVKSPTLTVYCNAHVLLRLVLYYHFL